jgi:cysteine-rich repeat protein
VSTCGNGTVDPGETCDDANTDATDACISCQKAFCGDGYIQTGVEQCDPNAFTWSGKCDNQCNRTIYTPCPTGTGCSSDTHCIDYTMVTQAFCGPGCTTTAATCPGIPGYTNVCNFDNCSVLCNNRTCPLGMTCAPNIPVVDPVTGTTTMMVDICVIQN